VEADVRYAVVGQRVDRAQRVIFVTVVGAEAEQRLREQAALLLAQHRLEGTELRVRRAGGGGIDPSQLRDQVHAEVQRDLAQLLGEQLARSEAQRSELQAQLQARAQQAGVADTLAPALLAELRAQQPEVLAATLAEGRRVRAAAAAASAPAAEPVVVVLVEVSRPLRAADRQRLAAWLAVRLGRGPVDLIERVARPSR